MTPLHAKLASSLTLALAGLLLAGCSTTATATGVTAAVDKATAGASRGMAGGGTAQLAAAAGQQGMQAVVAACGASGVRVSTASGLSSALAGARPGERILLAPGTYPGQFRATRPGSPSAPITLCGPRSAVLNGGSTSSGYTFYLDKASWWHLEGFTVTGGQKGIVADTSSHDLIDGLYVHGTGDEAIHLRDFSSYDTISGNRIRGTGLNKSFYGEGIYVGSANDNWCLYSGCRPDASDHDVIIGNSIAGTTAENIDIKEGTSYGLISGNQLNGTGMDPASATSWVNVKGNDWTITGNTGTDSNYNGFSVHQVYPGWGIGNTFTSNRATVNGPGYGYYVQDRHLMTVVACSNEVSLARSGFSNLPCTQA